MIAVATREGIATVTLSRPERRNALDLSGFRRLADTWRGLCSDPDVRAVVVTGSGGDFCSGADLTTFAAEMSEAIGAGVPAGELWADINAAVLRELWPGPPVLAAVEGACFGAGFELVGATDIRIAGRSARFALPEVRHGVIASGGTLARLARQIPYAAAMRLVLTGAPAEAADLARVGFLNEVVADGSALGTAQSIAEQIAGNAPGAVRASKQIVRDGMLGSLKEAFALEERVSRKVLAGDEAAEGRRAFAERRPPRWGRP
jgi:enoyl-CoA hydratase